MFLVTQRRSVIYRGPATTPACLRSQLSYGDPADILSFTEPLYDKKRDHRTLNVVLSANTAVLLLSVAISLSPPLALALDKKFALQIRVCAIATPERTLVLGPPKSRRRPPYRRAIQIVTLFAFMCDICEQRSGSCSACSLCGLDMALLVCSTYARKASATVIPNAKLSLLERDMKRST